MINRFPVKLIVKPLSLFSMLAALAVILAACAPAAVPISTPAATIPVTSPAPATSTAPNINIATNASLGKILVDGNGKTLYIFTKDGPDQSNCDAKCLANWPPLIGSSTPKLGPGVDASLIGSASLSNGEKVITYDHMPLYTFIKDTKPGQTSGEDVGSVWYVISPDGKPVKPAASTAPTPTAAPAASAPTINVASNATLGQYLVDGNGMTLYAFTNDGLDQSNCDVKCLLNWPALLAQGNPIVGAGVDDSKIGTATLANGSKIVTYNHMPLYIFIKDTKPGDISGQGVGSVWYVVSPDGKIINK